jgi:hypothetical protein
MYTAETVWVLALFTHYQQTTDTEQQSNIHNFSNDITVTQARVQSTQRTIHIRVRQKELRKAFQLPFS